MYISPHIQIINTFVYLDEYEALVLSDLHLGYEQAVIRSGMLIPKTQYSDMVNSIGSTVSILNKKNHAVKKIILNGDIIHEFGTNSFLDKRVVKEFITFLEGIGEVIFVEGNHDAMLKYLSKSYTVHSTLTLGNILITHGDKIIPKSQLKNIKTIIIGHDHPSINLISNTRSEKYKCFLKGTHNKIELLVMPTCNPLSTGTDVLEGKCLSPYLKNNSIESFEVFIVQDEGLAFGKVKDIKNKMQ